MDSRGLVCDGAKWLGFALGNSGMDGPRPRNTAGLQQCSQPSQATLPARAHTTMDGWVARTDRGHPHPPSSRLFSSAHPRVAYLTASHGPFASQSKQLYQRTKSSLLQQPINCQKHPKMSGRGKGGKAKTGGKAKSRSSRAGLQFPVGRLHRLLRKGEGEMEGIRAIFCPILQVTTPNVLAPALQSLWQPCWNTWPRKCWNWQAMLQGTTRRPGSTHAISNWPCATTRS